MTKAMYGEADPNVKTKKRRSSGSADKNTHNKPQSWQVRQQRQTDQWVKKWKETGRCPVCREPSGYGVTCGHVICSRAWIKGKFPNIKEVEAMKRASGG